MRIIRRAAIVLGVFFFGFAASIFAASQGLYLATKPASILKRFISPPAYANNNYQLALPIQESVPVAPFTLIGDSLSGLGPWNRLLKADFNNFGVIGDTSAGVLARMEKLPIGPKVMVQFGTNDAMTGINIATTQANTDAILKRLAGKNVIFAIVPLTAHDNMNEDITPIAAYQRSACRRTPGCTVLDLQAILSKEGHLDPIYTTDGVHLNYAAYKRWAAAVPAE